MEIFCDGICLSVVNDFLNEKHYGFVVVSHGNGDKLQHNSKKNLLIELWLYLSW